MQYKIGYKYLFLISLSMLICAQKNLCSSEKINIIEKSEKNETAKQSEISEKSEKNTANKAFVCVPIADLIGDMLDLEKNNKFQTYETLPLEAKKGTGNCKRIIQAIFNETVEIVATKGNQVKVKMLNTFYENKNLEKQSTYWAKKDNFIYFQDLKKAKLDKNLIPTPINYENTNITKDIKNIVTLKLPFYDQATGKTYSAGTRFVETKNLPESQITQATNNTQAINNTQATNNTQVFIFDKTGNKYSFKKTEIPLELCANNAHKNNNQKRQEFLEITKSWANIKDGFIPYVWGGSSYTQTCNKDQIIVDPEFQVYTRPEFNYTPTPGLDCSGLVARAAQICNIPYFYKNSTTAKNNLKKIENLKDLRAGDLIIYTGHVIIVFDVKNNKIIEARTNEHGCGRVHEVNLSEVFAGIKTYQDLFDLRNSGKILERIDTSEPDKEGGREKIQAFDFYCLIS